MTALEGWANFYVLVGSSAGAFVRLQFVVLVVKLAMTPGLEIGSSLGVHKTA